MVRIRLIGLGAVLGHPDLSITTPHGAWAATLASSLFVAFALACSIPMRLPVASAVVGTAVVIPKI